MFRLKVTKKTTEGYDVDGSAADVAAANIARGQEEADVALQMHTLFATVDQLVVRYNILHPHTTSNIQHGARSV